MTALLSARDLGLLRGERCLFRAVEFALEPGDLLQIEGANGAGKTSLLRLVAGLIEADSGDVFWQGRSIRQAAQAYRSELVWVGHKTGCKNDLTLVENLRFEYALRPRADRSLDEVLQRLQLTPLADLPLRALSAGQQRRTALARVLLSGVRLWLMDEPFTNLDADGRALVRELLTLHLQNGGLCIAASHQALEIDGAQQRLVLS